jgi:probable HAF family extracellular repeat protein
LPIAFNDDGEVVGAAAFQDHPFDAAIWKDSVVTDLGTLPGDCFSQAFVMNSRGQIAGNSATCDGNTIRRAALWEDGEVFDLNELIPPTSSLLLVESNAINDRGEIAGNGFPAGCTDFSCTHAFVLIPCDGEHSAGEGCEDDREAAVARVQSSTVPVSQNLVTATGSPTPGEIAARIRAQLCPESRPRGLTTEIAP